MRLLQDPVRKYLSEKIQSLYPEVELTSVYEQLVEPPNTELGDLAFGCFLLAKAQKKAPPLIAKSLQEQIPADSFIQKIEAVGPYVNFKISPEFFGKSLLAPILSGDFAKRKLTDQTPKTMIEYSQPNTHKELHVGHMRNACLGDSIVRLQRFCGYEVIASTFPGDVGTHVAKCLWYLKNRNTEPIPSVNKGEWLGAIYSRANLLLEDEEKTDKGPENQRILTAILFELEQKKGPYYELWKETRQWSVDLMKRVYDWADIHFDQWYWESDVDSDSVKFVKELFAEGKLVQSEGAIGMNLEAENLGFCLLLKSDGTGLYATKDVELAKRKFRDFKIQKSIYVVDVRQELHFKQIFKVLEKIGFEEAKDCFHLKYNFVELPDGAMSSRKGNIVPLMELVRRMEEMVRAQYLNRYQGEWEQTEVDLVASQVAKGAIKYGMLRIDTNKKIVFDMNEWLKIDGESGPFIQYSSARIRSLVRKLKTADNSDIQWNLLQHPAERKLMQGLLQFQTTILAAAEQYKPSLVCTYLYDLAKRFNLFYHECSIGQAESPELRRARLALAECTGNILTLGLSLIGIPSPERM